jgi:RNA recognition motif
MKVTLIVLVGYCFLLFQDELSVQALVEACTVDDSKLYWCVSSPTMKDKPVSPLLYYFGLCLIATTVGRLMTVLKVCLL